MKRLNTWLAVMCLGFLSACSISPKIQAPSLTYDFGLPTSGQVPGWPGIALELRSPSWFDSLGIDYRLAYDDPLRLREYADSRWAVNPGVLLAQRLRQSLGFSGGAGAAAAECLLRIELHEFSQLFDSPAASRGVLQGVFVLVDGKARILTEQRFLVERKAASPDARGGVGALVQAANGLTGFLSDGLAALREKHGPDFCQPRGRVN